MIQYVFFKPLRSKYKMKGVKPMSKKEKKPSPTEIAETLRSTPDVLGSYTGTGRFDEKPEQDADDL